MTSFDLFIAFPGDQRAVQKRGSSVFRFEVEGRTFFLKRNRLHHVELSKQLLGGKVPPRSELREWEAIQAVSLRMP